MELHAIYGALQTYFLPLKHLLLQKKYFAAQTIHKLNSNL